MRRVHGDRPKPTRFLRYSLSFVRLPLSSLALALCVYGCSGNATAPAAPSTPAPAPATTPAPVTTTATCTYSLSATNLAVEPIGGALTITVTSGAGCAWTATSASSFVSVQSGASGSGAGSVVLKIDQDGTTNRTGTATIAGQTLTITQTGQGIIPSFNMYDPPSVGGPTNTCRVRGSDPFSLTTCPLLNTTRGGRAQLTNWAWTIRYTYGGVAKVSTQSSPTITDFWFSEFCGLAGSSAEGTAIPLSIALTVTDADGIQATATSGSGNQPAATMVAYTCGS